MSALLLLGTVLGVGALLLVALVSAITTARARAALAAGVAAAWAAAYALLLIGTSLLSREEVLVPGDIKYFCGFFLDCHIGVAVAGVRSTGTRLTATLRFTSSARRASLRPYDVQVEVAGIDGQSIDHGTPSAPLEREIEPGGGYTVDVVFDVPAGVRPARLLVYQGIGIDRLIDGLVIGQDGSFLHRRTYLALPAS